jgi:starvation-inducible DNA-binding protein
MYATRIDVSISVREKVVPLLQAHLTNCVDLFTQVKQAHWNVKGPHFIALHELFDRIAEIVEQQSDVLAERINALGGRANGTARIVAMQSSLTEFPLDAEDGPIYVAAVADKLSMFGKRVRIDICCAAKFGDAGTADILTEISREIDRQLWSLDAHLQAER